MTPKSRMITTYDVRSNFFKHSEIGKVYLPDNDAKLAGFLQQRFIHNDDATLSVLSSLDQNTIRFPIPRFIVEDEPREDKVAGETRIVAGIYELLPVTNSPMALRYKSKFGHENIIGLYRYGKFLDKDVIHTNLRVHIGNTEKDTEGCPCIGNACDLHHLTVGYSTPAYEDFWAACNRYWNEYPDHTAYPLLYIICDERGRWRG